MNLDKYDDFVLSGDVGGTNSTLALVGKSGKKFDIIKSIRRSSSDIIDFSDTVAKTIKELKQEFPTVTINKICFGIAGPIEGNHCQPTNTTWSVNTLDIEKKTGVLPTMINDFSALCYGVTALDVNNPDEIVKMVQPDGTIPEQTGTTIAVVGAGTGLGVGFVAEKDGENIVFPSEGGHFDFPPFDEDTIRLHAWFRKKFGFYPGMERFVSGIGLENIFAFCAEETTTISELDKEILSKKEKDKAPLIAQNVNKDDLCTKAHALFRKIYGRAVSNYAVSFIPTKGIFVAGGIISKDLNLFLSDDLFMSHFLINHNENLRRVLKKTPVFIVKNYSTSILGAALAAF